MVRRGYPGYQKKGPQGGPFFFLQCTAEHCHDVVEMLQKTRLHLALGGASRSRLECAVRSGDSHYTRLFSRNCNVNWNRKMGSTAGGTEQGCLKPGDPVMCSGVGRVLPGLAALRPPMSKTPCGAPPPEPVSACGLLLPVQGRGRTLCPSWNCPLERSGSARAYAPPHN